MGLLKTHVLTHCQPSSIQDWLSADPQDMKELLDKLTQENQQIAQLEAQLQVRTTRFSASVLIITCCLQRSLLWIIDLFFVLFFFQTSQSQKEQLDSALQAVVSSGDEAGRADLELENTKLRAELSALPQLKTELESLRARVTELSQLTGAAGVCRASAVPSLTYQRNFDSRF